MKEEIFEKTDVYAAGIKVGCITVRYPCFSLKNIDLFYKKSAENFIAAGQRELQKLYKKSKRTNFAALLQCRVTHSDESYISVMTHARFYSMGNMLCHHSFSLVWNTETQQLHYIRKRGKRHYDICYNGREMVINN